MLIDEIFFFLTDKINSHVNPISGKGAIISLRENQKLGKNREIDQRERDDVSVTWK